MVGPAVQRDAVAHLQAVMGLSERRASSIVGADRKMVRYRCVFHVMAGTDSTG